jgi:hypothetical protein
MVANTMSTGLQCCGMSQYAKCSETSSGCLLNKHGYLQNQYQHLTHTSFINYSTKKKTRIQNVLVTKSPDITINTLRSDGLRKLFVSTISEIQLG